MEYLKDNYVYWQSQLDENQSEPQIQTGNSS